MDLSVRLDDGRWLNAAAGRPPVPPLGRRLPRLVPALGRRGRAASGRWACAGRAGRCASSPSAADRLGRGEAFAPLPETGPQETRRANVAFNRMRERLDRYIRDRTAMLAAVAHDLRTPITSLRLQAEFIEDEEAKAKILESLAEMQAMAEAVLAFARGDAESEPTRPTDIRALVESLVEDAAEAGRDIAFAESPAATLPCRPFALKRAVGNLIENAAFYGARARVRLEVDSGGGAHRRRGRRPRHRGSRAGARVRAVRAPGRLAQPPDRRRRARPLHRPHHRPQPRRRRQAGEPHGRRAAGDVEPCRGKILDVIPASPPNRSTRPAGSSRCAGPQRR